MSRRTRKGTAFALLIPVGIGLVGSLVFAVVVFFTAFDEGEPPDGYWACMQYRYEVDGTGGGSFEADDPICFDPHDPDIAEMPTQIRRTAWEERRQAWTPSGALHLP